MIKTVTCSKKYCVTKISIQNKHDNLFVMIFLLFRNKNCCKVLIVIVSMLFKNDFYYCNSDTTMARSRLPLIYYLFQGQIFNVIRTCLLFSMYERSVVNIRAFDSASVFASSLNIISQKTVQKVDKEIGMI